VDALLELAKEGARNLVENCAEVQTGELVVLVNDQRQVDRTVSTLLEEAVRARRASSAVLWVEPEGLDPRGGRARGVSLSAEQIASLLKADKVIASIGGAPLGRYLADSNKRPLLVNNGFYTLEDLASGHARYHWGIVQAIYDVMDHDVFPVGSHWRITSPAGTDLRGAVDTKSARASYVDEMRQERVRNFFSGAYMPVASQEAEGVIVVEWVAMSALEPAYDPPHVVVQHNKIAGVEGGSHIKKWVKEYHEAFEGLVKRFGDNALLLDSWHGGAHPKAVNIPGMVGTGGTRHMHFHMGRTTGKTGDYQGGQIKYFTMEVDGKKIYDTGRLALLDHPKITAAAERCGLENWR
jgi:hypothetical protein